MTRFPLVLLALSVHAICVAAESASTPTQVAAINEPIEEGWRDFRIQPSPEADDATWCRRLFLDVIGRIPSNQELKEFLDQRGIDKRAKLVDRLLSDQAFFNDLSSTRLI